MTSPDPKVAVLRSAGHTDAAALLESLNAMEQPATPTNDAPAQQVAAMTAEQARQQEGEALLASLYRAIPNLRPDTEPAA